MIQSHLKERPVYFRSEDGTLFGMYTHPAANANGRTILLLRGAGYGVISAYRHPLWTALAGRMAEKGYATLRFDYHGSGDSTGRGQAWNTEITFDRDLHAALSFVRNEGCDETLLVGQCFGARTALACASQIDDLVGLALIAPPVRQGIRFEAPPIPTQASTSALAQIRGTRQRMGIDRRLWQARRLIRGAQRRLDNKRLPRANAGATDRFLDPLEAVVERRVPTLLAYGTSDGLGDFESARAGRLGQILTSAGDLVEIKVFPGRLHGRSDASTQEALLDALSDWLARLSTP